MSRSGYCEDGDFDDNSLYLYRATVDRSLAGKRGQTFLKELARAMDAMPEKKLIRSELVTETGEVCTIGVVCKARGLDVSKVDEYCPEEVGKLVGIARSMAAEIEYENDDCGPDSETPEQRWTRMRKWVEDNIQVPE